MSEINDIKSFSIFKSYVEAMEKLKFEESRKEMSWAMIRFVYYNEIPKWTSREQDKKELIWTLIEPNLLASKNKAGNARGKSSE